MRRIVSALFLLAATLSPQQTGTNKPAGAGETPTFSTSAQLVVEAVSVRDKDGKPIEGLKASDFTVLEDGAQQTIKFFEYQRIDEAAAALPPLSLNRPEALPRLPTSSIKPETPGDVRYNDRRMLALYFDLSGMPLPDQFRAFDAAQKFVRTQMTSRDLVALLMFSQGTVRVLQDFTDDRERLMSILETLLIGEDENAPIDTTDSGAAFGQNDGEFNIFFTDRQLAALQTAAGMLGRLNEKKALVYFASGLRLNGSNNQAQLHATINAAVRAGVSFWPVDARGLVAMPPLGDATRQSPGGLAMYTGVAAGSMTANLQRSQDTLWTLAADTGGKALLDYNDLSRGITQAQQAYSSYYILGYYTTNTNLDGRFRRIKIALNGHDGAKLDYRQGYYAGKVFSKFTEADKERQLEDALALPDPITELTIALEVNYFQLNRAEYFVPIAVKIPGSELARAKRGGAERTTIDFIGEVREGNSTMANLRDKVDIKLSDATAAELATRPIAYDTGFTLLPGSYTLKFLARDAVTGRIGTYIAKLVIPNLNREDKRIPLSSVVLSSQMAPLNEALFTAGKDKGARSQVFSPLVSDGQKMIPSVTRVFSRRKEMFVYAQAYQPSTSAHPMAAFVTFFRDGVKVFETAPLKAADPMGTTVKALPFRFQFPIEKLEPGEYTCQLTVLNAGENKAAFWQAPVMVAP